VRYFYVITPIGADPEFAAKKATLEDIGRRHGCAPFFPLDHHDLFSIQTAKSDLRDSILVLTDLSYERPSCYFELGLAQALDLPVVLLAARGTRIHQMADGDRIHWYTGMQEYKTIIAEVLAEAGCRAREYDAAQQGDAAGVTTRRS
jgi:hypothetical protein